MVQPSMGGALTSYMWNVRVPSVVQLFLLLPGVLGRINLENAPRCRTLVGNLGHAANSRCLGICKNQSRVLARHRHAHASRPCRAGVALHLLPLVNGSYSLRFIDRQPRGSRAQSRARFALVRVDEG